MRCLLAWRFVRSACTAPATALPQCCLLSHPLVSLSSHQVDLQDAGLLISRKDHGAHHKAPFNEKYSIVSGWCNPLLDGDCPGARVGLLVLLSMLV